MKKPACNSHAATALLSLVVLSAFHGINHTFSIFLSPLNEDIRTFFGADTISAITSLKTTYLMVYAASNFFFGFLTNRVSSRKILAAGGILNGIAIGSFIFVTPRSFPVMYVLWAAAGLGGGVYHPVANVLITRLFPSRMGWAIGITGMGASTGFAFGPLFTGVLHGPVGMTWQQVSLLFGGLGVAMGISVFIILKDLPSLLEPRYGDRPPVKNNQRNAQSRSPADSIETDPDPSITATAAPLKLYRENRVVPMGFVFFLSYIIFASGLREITIWSVMDISDFFLTRAHGAGNQTSYLLFLMYLVGIFAQPAAGTVSDRMGRHRLAAVALFVHGSAICLLAVVPGALLFLPFIFIGIGQASSVPSIEAMVADATDVKSRGLVFGFLVTIGMGMGATGPLFSGVIIDRLGGTIASY
ncbi:MAG: MFS transporter, partial [Spirochaetota bacterium]